MVIFLKVMETNSLEVCTYQLFYPSNDYELKKMSKKIFLNNTIVCL